MICSIKFLDKRFANEVRNLVGNDDVKFYSYLGNAIENIINPNNLKNFDEEKAQKLKKELIRKKYSKKYAVKYMKRV